MPTIVPEFPDGLTLPILEEILGEEAPTDSELQSIFQAIKPFEKIKYSAMISPDIPDEEDTDHLCSKYGGKRPYISEQHPYPVCPHDNIPLCFFFQLSVSDIPEDIRPASLSAGSLIQLFKCSLEDECRGSLREGGADDPEYVCRLVTPPAETAISVYPTTVESIRCRKVIEWSPCICYPNSTEFFETTSDDVIDEWSDYLFEGLEAKFEYVGDGICGYADWIQGVDFRECPVCGAASELVYHMESNDCLDYMFGDLGACQIVVCPEHGDCVQMVWACH
ncbi:Protein of unknown function DUF1963 like protein [Aduncisulcus paluster]|uniref:DUF1963 domain-containing protein n=1 Tax=Aduncisulcus paluster TaxID=2918883 RepID=A0ABQ5KWB3_9EUKA|nr:Protein of unknown function DUF1963 like protein [Aduncisulcus paluster]